VGRNLTVQLDEDVVRKAKILAAQRATSVSRLVADEIERLVEEDLVYRQAHEVALHHLQRGFHLGGGTLPKRDELHGR
jgi:predicted transcriptional regulator